MSHTVNWKVRPSGVNERLKAKLDTRATEFSRLLHSQKARRGPWDKAPIGQDIIEATALVEQALVLYDFLSTDVFPKLDVMVEHDGYDNDDRESFYKALRADAQKYQLSTRQLFTDLVGGWRSPGCSAIFDDAYQRRADVTAYGHKIFGELLEDDFESKWGGLDDMTSRFGKDSDIVAQVKRISHFIRTVFNPPEAYIWKRYETSVTDESKLLVGAVTLLSVVNHYGVDVDEFNSRDKLLDSKVKPTTDETRALKTKYLDIYRNYKFSTLHDKRSIRKARLWLWARVLPNKAVDAAELAAFASGRKSILDPLQVSKDIETLDLITLHPARRDK